MAIGTPVAVGHGGATSGHITTVTTTAAIPAGALILIAAAHQVSGSIVASISDGANTYSFAINDGATFGCCIAYVPNCKALPSGSTITITWSSSSSSINIATVCYATGMATSAVLDQAPSPTSSAGSGTSATPIATGTLSSSKELLFSAIGVGGGNSSITPGGSWATLDNLTESATSFWTAYQIVSSTTSVSWAPSWHGSAGYKSLVATFKGAGSSFSDTVAETESAADTESATANLVVSQIESGTAADASTSALLAQATTTEAGAAADNAGADVIPGVKGAGRPKARRRWEILLPDGSVLASADETEHRARLQGVREEAQRAVAAEAARQEAAKLRRLAAAVERRQAQRPDDDAAIALLLTAL